jgi:2-(1,2-epoxy-1,2-dihydrophenyl)acetyl-CoA isomerase
MGTDSIALERHGHVALLTLNRPEKLNALNTELRGELLAALDEIHRDDSLRALVLTGAGRGFCSGADLTGGGARPPRQEPPSQNARLDELGWVGRQAKAVYELDKPTLAAVNGVAAGAGMSLALACDLRVGSEQARFKTVFLERSLSPDSGMSFFLPRIVGYSRAADLIFSSRAVDADESYRIGLLDRLVPAAELLPRSLELASQIAAMPPLALRSAKRVLQHNLEVGLDAALRYELQGLDFARRSPHDVAESRASFVEKRPPVFTGD